MVRVLENHKFLPIHAQIYFRRYYDVPPNGNGTDANDDANDDEPQATRAILPKDVKRFFMSRFFICYEYNELSQSTEEEMFQLVQRGIALTPAEKMRAMSTEWAKFARQYEEDYSMVMGRQYFLP
jgi:hypothetical protein